MTTIALSDEGTEITAEEAATQQRGTRYFCKACGQPMSLHRGNVPVHFEHRARHAPCELSHKPQTRAA